jgi:pyridoxamine 5'-phosphate oxidase family protein
MLGNERFQDGGAASFTEAEVEYIAENFIGRVATTSPSGQPHVVPVAYRFDGKTITFGGNDLTKTLNFRNMMANALVAFVVDDVVSVTPWKARGVEVRGRAEPVYTEDGTVAVRIIPSDVRSWGLDR